jgi:hypothetical protein
MGIDVVSNSIALAQERKAAGLTVVSERKPAEEYNREVREARKVYGPEARRHASMRWNISFAKRNDWVEGHDDIHISRAVWGCRV